MSRFELLAALFGITSVALSVKQSVWSWPVGVANVTLYVVVFYGAELYANMGLQVIYIVLSFYGWYQWLYGGRGRTTLPVSRTSTRLALALLAIGVTFSASLGVLLGRLTDASLPVLDSAATATSLVAQYMMTRKLLECWLVWIAVDVVYVGMFLYKSLYLTAGLYAVFLLLAFSGYREWKRSLRAA